MIVSRRANAPRSSAVIIRSARVVLPHSITGPCDVLIRDGYIAGIAPEIGGLADASVVDAADRYLTPGLIDIHCHGDGENSFFDDPNTVAANLVSRGTTGSLATLGYSIMQRGGLHRQIKSMWEARNAWAKRAILGIHLEGPYVNPNYGAHRKLGMSRPPDPAEYEPVLADFAEIVRLWTCAPELAGADAFIAAVAAHGIVLAAGHTEAGAEVVRSYIPSGMRVVTHWSNACGAPDTRFKGTREPGVEQLALASDDVFAEVICDAAGYHVRPLMLQVLYRAKGPDQIIFISDATFNFPGNRVQDTKSDVNFSVDGELAGSRLTMLAAARNFRRHVGCDLPAVFRMGALNPARLFGWSHELGSVEIGKAANLLLVDDELTLHGVWLHGESPAA